MKNFIIFSISFIVVYALIQIASGMILTFLYTPDVDTAWEMSAKLPQETVLLNRQSSVLLPFITAFLSASIAFFVARKYRG